MRLGNYVKVAAVKSRDGMECSIIGYWALGIGIGEADGGVSALFKKGLMSVWESG